MERLRGLVSSWSFAPHQGPEALALFKRLKELPCDFRVIQGAHGERDERLLPHVTRAALDRVEVAGDFGAAVLQEFQKAPESYDFLLSSGDFPSLAAAWQLKKARPRLPWIVCFGESFARDPYRKYLGQKPPSPEELEAERLALRHAELVVLGNEHLKHLLFSGGTATRAHEAVIIPPGYDTAMYAAEPGARNERFTFMHFGPLDAVKRTAEPLLRAVDRLIELYPRYKGRFELVFFGEPVAPGDLQAFAHLRNRNQVRFEEPLPYLEGLRRMRQADALLLSEGLFSVREDGLEASPFLPGRLIDYMGAEKPMSAITMDCGPTAEFLRASGNLVADARVDRIAYVLKRYVDGKISPDYSHYHRYQGALLAPRMEEALRRTVELARRQPSGGSSCPFAA
ncbi:hypothetical protein [Archangium lansingense]|uniref:Glycosyltransferase involved in cell wall biosynthesis n=1 Tax=Archangium lansingense TaxID=2995310 RepID=A0ABT4ADA5_9BACT|nr:hypothetical protein [Archangium lansinium]MCY1079615.1 hypothetical protein [Archangium lansinium]